jgi:Zn-dependent metalloprotease
MPEIDSTRARIALSPATGTAHLVTAVENKFGVRRSSENSIEEALLAFLVTHPEIGITDPKKQLIEIGRQRDTHIKQWTIVTYQQLHEGLVVESALLKIIYSDHNAVVSSSSTIVADLRLSIIPTITEQQAIDTAKNVLANDM